MGRQYNIVEKPTVILYTYMKSPCRETETETMCPPTGWMLRRFRCVSSDFYLKTDAKVHGGPLDIDYSNPAAVCYRVLGLGSGPNIGESEPIVEVTLVPINRYDTLVLIL